MDTNQWHTCAARSDSIGTALWMSPKRAALVLIENPLSEEHTRAFIRNLSQRFSDQKRAPISKWLELLASVLLKRSLKLSGPLEAHTLSVRSSSLRHVRQVLLARERVGRMRTTVHNARAFCAGHRTPLGFGGRLLNLNPPSALVNY